MSRRIGDQRQCSTEKRQYALGEWAERPEFAVDSPSFGRMPRPRSGDWLAQHEERGQSIKSFLRGSYRAEPHATYKTISVVPMSANGEQIVSRSMEMFLAAFFGPACNVSVEDPIDLESLVEDGTLTTRSHDGFRQILTGDLHRWLATWRREQSRARFNLLSIVVTTDDLYPGDDWNFVFGEADIMSGTGVFSLARMVAHDEPGAQTLASLKVLAHELCHLFGMRHCVHYLCLMNGSNHADELARAPLFLCPVCLCKLSHALGYHDLAPDVLRATLLDRYERMLEALESDDDHYHSDACAWLRTREEELLAPAPAT